MLVGGGVRLPGRVGLQRVDELIAATTEAREDDDGQNPERWCAGESLQHSGSNAGHLQSVVARRVGSRAARWVPVTLGALFLAACGADPVALTCLVSSDQRFVADRVAVLCHEVIVERLKAPPCPRESSDRLPCSRLATRTQENGSAPPCVGLRGVQTFETQLRLASVEQLPHEAADIHGS
jgi:hypothetical protein